MFTGEFGFVDAKQQCLAAVERLSWIRVATLSIRMQITCFGIFHNAIRPRTQGRVHVQA